MRRLPLPLPSARLAVTVLAAVMTTVLGAGAAVPAWAHTRLVSSTPAQGAPAGAPDEVVLVFSDPVQAGLSAVSVTGGNGREHASGTPAPAGDGSSVRQLLRAPLEPGVYRVAYRVLAADGHPVTGSFELTAAAAGAPVTSAATPGPTGAVPTAPASPPATAALRPTAGTRDEGSGLPVVPLAVGGLVVAGAAGLLARRLAGAPAGS